MTKSTLNKMSEIGAAMTLDSLPAEVVQKAVMTVIDALEGCVVGSDVEEGCAPLLRAMENISEEKATLYGHGSTADVWDAIFFNIVSGTLSARNDIHTAGRVHPGCTLVPAVLGEAEANHLSGKAVLEAIVLGCETMIRLGMALQKGTTYPVSGSLRASMLATPMGNAFAAAKLFGYDEERMANAAALALNHLCGVNQWRLEATGEDAHQNAWDAKNAFDSARFAGAGVRGSKGNLDGQYGFLSVFGAEQAGVGMLDEFGERFDMLDTMSKPVGACMRLLAPCQLAQDLLDDPAFSVENMEKIVVKVNKRIAENAWFASKNINGQSAAINSVPYGIAGVLAAGDINAVPWYPPYEDKAIAMMDLVELEYDEYCRTRLDPQGIRVIAHMKDGNTIEKERLVFATLTPEEIEAKFLHTMTEHYGSDKAHKMLSMARNLASLRDVSEFTKLFRK